LTRKPLHKRLEVNICVGHLSALAYLSIKPTNKNIEWIRRSRVGRQRGLRYYYRTDDLDRFYRKEILATLREINEPSSLG